MDSEEVIKRLKEYYPKYEKNINIYPDIIKEIDLAIDGAKKLEKYQTDNNRRIGTVEANPNTEVYKIVEYLMKKGQELIDVISEEDIYNAVYEKMDDYIKKQEV